MNILSRFIINIRRKTRAQSIGVPFKKRANFILPHYLVLDEIKKDIYIPDEENFKSMFTEIFLDDDYSLESLKKEKVETIVDIGANIGLFSIWARAIFPAAKIHAYEPDPQWQPCLRKNADVFNFSCFPEAVGGHLGNVKMSGGMWTVEDDSPGIKMVSFGSCIERIGGGADLVKVDCEGAEWGFLDNIEAWKRVKFITMEYHLWPGKHSVKEVQDKIMALGFKISRIKPLSRYTGMLLAVRV